MKESIFNKSGMKQIIDSGFKTFDKQTNLITYGNVIANTQISSYIRTKTETTCNGFDFKEDELRQHDLQWFKKYLNSYSIKRIEELTENKQAILYMFFITNKKKEIDPIGFILTDSDHLKVLYFTTNKDTEKRYQALKYLIDFIIE